MASGNVASRGVHFCGSIKLPDEPEKGFDEVEQTRKIMQYVTGHLATRLRRLPDGETGLRDGFADWQLACFMKTPEIVAPHILKLVGMTEAQPAIDAQSIELNSAGYAKYAIQSYQIFAKLKSEGLIHPETRFQVGIPTPINIVSVLVHSDYHQIVEPIYAKTLTDEIRQIQEQIPHTELAIQWDCPIEVSIMEKLSRPYDAWINTWNDGPMGTLDSLVSRIKQFSDLIKPDVELGIHLCYGDYMHKHFMEPKDTKVMTDLVNAISDSIDRRIQWFHLPVPVSRKDEAYFAPMKELRLHPETELYLGLVHAHDLDGTRERISAAQKVLSDFGIGTECGLGRTPISDVESIMSIQKAVSQSILSDQGK